ncbi:MAG: helix-turn-helix transcriptional regulator, partial [Pseudomonadota bacterium]|nr:helix-turn-helix transcriptional regulator [Pseudomonadota bacterium]
TPRIVEAFCYRIANIALHIQIGLQVAMVDQFSSRLRALRAEKVFSLRALAKMVGVTANAVLRWEKAEVTPTRDKMIELAEAFEVEPGWLAWGIGDRNPRTSVEAIGKRLELCSGAELKAVATLLDAFLMERDLAATNAAKKQES